MISLNPVQGRAAHTSEGELLATQREQDLQTSRQSGPRQGRSWILAVHEESFCL